MWKRQLQINSFYISNSECLCQGYFNTARLELSEHNIGVQIICPGPVKSEITKYAFSEDINKVNRIFLKILIKNYEHQWGLSQMCALNK